MSIKHPLKYLLSKAINPRHAFGALRHPKRIVSFAKEATADIRGETRRNELNMYVGASRALATLAGRLNLDVSEPVGINDHLEDVEGDSDCAALEKLLKHHGSDKSTRHNYHLIYGAILKGRRLEPLRILEIGLGTNNTEVPSNMGSDGRPGASLRAFRDWAPNASISGADVDQRILFAEERIQTFFVDQTKPETLRDLASHFGPASFDLIIDDGLHNPFAAFNTIDMALGLVNEGGTIIIEDIWEQYLPIWQAAKALLSTRYECQLVRTATCFACLIRAGSRS